MRKIDRTRSRRMTSMPGLIAWLSVCLLAAAWGHSLDAQWQTIWAQMGAFGLVAAVGLGAIEKARSAREQRLRDRTLQVRLECGLARLNQHSATVDSINEAVRRLCDQASADSQAEVQQKPKAKRRSQSQVLGEYPLEIMPVEEQGGMYDIELSQPTTGSVRQISSRAVSFEHTEKFTTRMVLLTFRLGGQKKLSFVVDVMWTQKNDKGFVSGGTVLAVGVPATESAAMQEAAPIAGTPGTMPSRRTAEIESMEKLCTPGATFD